MKKPTLPQLHWLEKQTGIPKERIVNGFLRQSEYPILQEAFRKMEEEGVS